MSYQLLNEKKEIFQEVIQLSNTWRAAHDKAEIGTSMKEINEFYATDEGKKISQLLNNVKEYMQTLDFEDIKMLEVVMYLGRDKDYHKTLTPEEIYEDYTNYFNKEIGFKTKEIEINQMTGKGPLASYLEDGLKILEIKL